MWESCLSPPDQKAFRNKQFNDVQCLLFKLGMQCLLFKLGMRNWQALWGNCRVFYWCSASLSITLDALLPIKRHHQTSCFEWLCLVAMPLPPHMPLKYQKLHFPSKSILIFCRANGTLHAGCMEIEEALEKGLLLRYTIFLWPYKKTLSKL